MTRPHATLKAVESELGRATSTKTTLYELIEAISSAVEPEEERLVPGIVLNLIDSGKIRIWRSLD